MPVAIRAQRRLRVVDVEGSEPLQADLAIDLLDETIKRVAIRHVASRGIEMARVEADPEAAEASQLVEDHSELVDRTANGASGARAVLEQNPGRP